MVCGHVGVMCEDATEGVAAADGVRVSVSECAWLCWAIRVGVSGAEGRGEVVGARNRRGRSPSTLYFEPGDPPHPTDALGAAGEVEGGMGVGQGEGGEESGSSVSFWSGGGLVDLSSVHQTST